MKKKARKKKIEPMETEAIKSLDVPATQRMLLETEAKLCARMDIKFEQLEGKINSLQAEMRSGFKSLEEKMHQFMLLIEEQNARNIYVLDKLNFHSDRVDKLEVAVRDLQDK